MNPLRILMLIEEGLNPPDSIEGLNEEQLAPFKTEWDVYSALKKMGHEVQKLELHNELGAVRDAVTGGPCGAGCASRRAVCRNRSSIQTYNTGVRYCRYRPSTSIGQSIRSSHSQS